MADYDYDYNDDELIKLIQSMELFGDKGKHRWVYPARMMKDKKDKNDET